MFIIVGLIVLVAAFNIICTLIMVVMEKTKDIAILKSMGASAKSIMKIFMLQGVIIGGIGTLLGTAHGTHGRLEHRAHHPVHRESLRVQDPARGRLLPERAAGARQLR